MLSCRGFPRTPRVFLLAHSLRPSVVFSRSRIARPLLLLLMHVLLYFAPTLSPPPLPPLSLSLMLLSWAQLSPRDASAAPLLLACPTISSTTSTTTTSEGLLPSSSSLLVNHRSSRFSSSSSSSDHSPSGAHSHSRVPLSSSAKVAYRFGKRKRKENRARMACRRVC